MPEPYISSINGPEINSVSGAIVDWIHCNIVETNGRRLNPQQYRQQHGSITVVDWTSDNFHYINSLEMPKSMGNK